MKKRILSMILTLVMIISCLMMPATATSAVQADPAQPSESQSPLAVEMVDGKVIETTEKDNTETRILVSVGDGETVFLQTSDLELAVAASNEQQAGLYAAESAIATALGEEIEVDRYFSLVFNGFSFTGESWMIDAINEIDGLTAMEAIQFQLIEPEENETEVNLTPSMDRSTEMVGAVNAWDLGYTGKGMVIGVIDTGIKQTHEAFSIAPEDAKITPEYLEDIFSKYGDKMHGKNPEGAYYSAKLPYNWDYWDDDHIPNHTQSNHGSHVAGIAAGNNGDDFKGIAPDAQIVSLQIFTNTGSAYTDDMLAALEDSVYLGLDAINMSLGIANGFVSYSWPVNFEPVFTALEQAGVAVCVAAGNDQHAYISTSFGTWSKSSYRWLSSNPDTGITSTPATFVGSFTVGNSTVRGKGTTVTVNAAGYQFTPARSTNPETPFLDQLTAGKYTIVNIGNATTEEIEAAGGVSGKLALILTEGDGAESQKCANAAAAGAVGIIMYDNRDAGMNTAASLDVTSTIPFATVSRSYARTPIIKRAMGGGTSGSITVNVDKFSYDLINMVKSSSWGPTAQLTMKPEISAPGNAIISADGTASSAVDAYTSKTGTSMATPAVAGGVLLMKQYLKTIFPNATAKELTDLAYAYMMSTAGHINGFVRQQGSGVMNLENATKTKAYLTTTDDKRPKLELDDSEDGIFTISFKIHNTDTVDRTYEMSSTAMTDQVLTYEHKGALSSDGNYDFANKVGFYPRIFEPVTLNVISGGIFDMSRMCKLVGETTVSVPAGQTATVTLTLDASLAKRFNAATHPDGFFLEGWINLTDKTETNAIDLSIPYLGFVGDWDYPAMIDEGYWWQREYGVNNLAQFYTSAGGNGIYLGYGALDQGLGLNYYWDETGETYLADRNAISPNGDGYLDALTDFEFSLLRQPRSVKIYIESEDGKYGYQLYNETYSFRRETHPQGITMNNGLTYSGLYFNADMNRLDENESATFIVEVMLDHDEFKLEDNKLAKLEIPFTKDTIAPVVTAIDGGVEIQDTNYVAYYAVYTDARRTDMVFEDGVFAMERGVKETYLTDMDSYFVAVADYGCNEAFYYVTDGKAYLLDGEGFTHGRTIIAQRWNDSNKYVGSYSDPGVAGYAWHSLNDELKQWPRQLTELTTETDEGALNGGATDIAWVDKTASGKVYAAGMSYLYPFNPETLEVDRENKIRYWSDEAQRDVIWLKAFAIAPGTDNAYGLAVLDSDQHQCYVVSINLETGELKTLGWKIGLLQYPYFTMKDADTVFALKYSSGLLEEYNIMTGELEATTDIGLSANGSTGELGFSGYIFPMMYDEKDNRIFLTGNFNHIGSDRFFAKAGCFVMCDLDTLELDFFMPGTNAGYGFGAMFFLDEMMDIPQQEHICYIKETVAPTCTTEGYTLRVCAECGKEFKENITEANGHDYEAVVTEPTCTTLGYTTYTCKVCGDTYKDDYTPATDHKYGQWQTVKEATCTEKGQEKRTCECGAEEFRDVDVKGHDYKKTVTEPTCTTMGYTTYTCSVCGDTYKSDYVDAKGHDYKKTVTDPTCTEMGYTTYTCSVCKDSYKSDFTAPVAHKYGDWETVTAPTCTTEGQEKRTCECGAAEYRSTGKVGHKYESVVTEPTCTAMGYTTYTCSVCQDTYKTDFVAPVAHKYTETVTAPTCTEMGYTTYTCDCGDTYKDNYVAPTGHKYGDWETVKEATCTAKGQEKRSCACGAAEYRDTDMIAHKYAETVTAPTCTDMGYTTYTCAACGHSYASDYVAPTGHKFGDWEVTKESTCTEKGEEQRVCACGETETRATDKADHVFEDVVTAPTCTEVGYTNHVCTVCGHNYITDLTQPTGHDYEAVTTAPTCTEDGYTTYTCTVCGESYVDDIVPATGHTFGEWVLTTEPGCTEAGEETRYCADCDATEIREVAPVCPAEKFSDVDTKQWYHEGVCYVIRNGLMNGKSETVFAPNANLTRAELVTVLYRMAGEPSVEDLEHPFTDVADDTWYTDAVIWAYNAEVVKGISNTAFAPNANITREQIATILYRYAGAEEVEEDALADFADAGKVNAYAVDAMNWAVSVGLINGMDDATLAPQGNATRAQIATILMRYCEG